MKLVAHAMSEFIAQAAQSIETVSADGRKTLPVRLIGTLAAGVFVGLNLHVGLGVAWFTAALITEAAAYVLGAPRADGSVASGRRQAALLGTTFVQSCLWTGLALIYWL